MTTRSVDTGTVELDEWTTLDGETLVSLPRLAERADLPVETIRRWVREGLLHHRATRVGIRLYQPADVEDLRA